MPLSPPAPPSVGGSDTPAVPSAPIAIALTPAASAFPDPTPTVGGENHAVKTDRNDQGGPYPVSSTRGFIEFGVALLLTIILIKGFAAEAYIVPTGSMAPTLLGFHEEVVCPDCGAVFAVGLGDSNQPVSPLCLNCGRRDFPNDLEHRRAQLRGGDRLLVHKFLFNLREPRRWEVAVFDCPDDPGQAYVKRIVGLPGETVQLHNGDVFINGAIARKSLEEQRGMRLIVYDHDHPPPDIQEFPRFLARRGTEGHPAPSGWEMAGPRIMHRPRPVWDDQPDWLFYRHRDPRRGVLGPIRDEIPYNGWEGGGEHRIHDVGLVADLQVGSDVKAVMIRLRRAGDTFLATLAVDGVTPPRLTRNGQPIEIVPGPGLLRSERSARAAGRTTQRLEASLFDQRVLIAVDGQLLFEPFDYDDPQGERRGSSAPIAFGVLGGDLVVDRLRIVRDIYYTDHLAGTPKLARAVDQPVRLGPDEFFMLGDNSPVSNDSRFWSRHPFVPRSALVGKPFLVHLPSRLVPLKVLGDAPYWIPDPREIRYIR